MKTRKLFALCASMLIVTAFFNLPVYAGPSYDWKIPDNVRIVQKGAVDGVRTFNTVQAALTSITNANEANTYLIKVMPGTYIESQAPDGIVTKQYVSIIGSGQESTIIQLTNCLSIGDNSPVENLQISGFCGIRFTGINPVIRNITVKTTNVGIDDQSVSAEVSNSTIILSGRQGSWESADYAYWTYGAPVIKNSKIINANPLTSALYNGIGLVQGGGNVKVINSRIEATKYGILMNDAHPPTRVDVIDSFVSGNFLAISNYNGDTAFKAVNSQIIGGHNGITGRDKILNCYDQQFDLIPNQ